MACLSEMGSFQALLQGMDQVALAFLVLEEATYAAEAFPCLLESQERVPATWSIHVLSLENKLKHSHNFTQAKNKNKEISITYRRETIQFGYKACLIFFIKL